MRYRRARRCQGAALGPAPAARRCPERPDRQGHAGTAQGGRGSGMPEHRLCCTARGEARSQRKTVLCSGAGSDPHKIAGRE